MPGNRLQRINKSSLTDAGALSPAPAEPVRFAGSACRASLPHLTSPHPTAPAPPPRAGCGAAAGSSSPAPRGDRRPAAEAGSPVRAPARKQDYLLVSRDEYRSGSTCRQRWKKRTCRSFRNSSLSASAQLGAAILPTRTAGALRLRHARPRSDVTAGVGEELTGAGWDSGWRLTASGAGG